MLSHKLRNAVPKLHALVYAAYSDRSIIVRL
jgi:hypothetical protein